MKRQMPNRHDLAPLLKFKKPTLSPKERRLASALTIARAAPRYFSSNIGDNVSTSPILSKPYPVSSGGNSTSA